MHSLEEINEITGKIIGASFKVHSELGPGLLESSYKECLYYVLTKEGLFVEKEKALPLLYEEVKLDIGYRLDLFVERKVIVEIKSVEALTDVHTAQVLTYLKLTQSKVGLLINFNVADLKKGIKRLIH
ncbi:GxxExxY protein [Chitinophagaceae bacterium IBVUCB2]|nr:GxxExxY protein [Chitinophagaceae bacterium IBVUCB2]